MRKLAIVIVAGLVCIGCGEKLKEMKQGVNAMQDLAKAGEKMEENQNEAQKIQEERRAKGDTVSMPYADLQKYLPESISGYKLDGGPNGSKNDAQGYSMSTATQNYISEGENPSRLNVTLVDYGGSEGATSLMGMTTMAWSMSSEDDHQRASPLKMDVPTTAAYQTYNKDSKDATVIATTRYRYMITVSATNQTDDQSKLVEGVATDIVKKFEGK